MTYAPLDQTPQDTPLTLDPSVGKVPMSPDLAMTRGGQVSWAFGTDYNDVYNTLLNGDETQLRTTYALDEDNKTVSNVANLMRSNPVGMTPQILQSMMAPNSVNAIFEKKYASKAVDTLLDASSTDTPSETVKQAAEEDPVGTADDLSWGKNTAARTLIIQTALQNAQESLQNQSYFGRALDIGKSATALYPLIKLSGQIPGVDQGIFLGENLEEQRRTLSDMPLERFQEVFPVVMKRLINDNPGAAVEFAQAMLGQTDAERFMSNANTVFAAMDVGTVANIGKGIISKGFAKSVTKKAVNDVIDAGSKLNNTVPPSVAIAEAGGKQVDAAMQQVVNRIYDQEAGRITPERQYMEGALEVMKTDQGLATTPDYTHAQMAASIEQDTKNLAALKTRIDAIESPSRRSPAGEYTRLYRGETAGTANGAVPDYVKETPEFKATQEATGRWFSKSKEEAEHYAKVHGQGKVSYVDVPTEDVDKYLSANQPEAKRFSAEGRENEEYFLPKDLAAKRQSIAGDGKLNRNLSTDVLPPTEFKSVNLGGMKLTVARAAKREGPEARLIPDSQKPSGGEGVEHLALYKEMYEEGKTKLAAKMKAFDEFQKTSSPVPPNTSREIFARLTEMYDNATGAFANAVLGLQRVQSIGRVLANKQVLQNVWEDMKNQIPGLSNNYIQMTLPRLNHTTGKWHVDSILGKNTGELFSDITEAINTMHHNGLRVTHIDGDRIRGINSPGEAGVSIGNVGGKYYAYYSRPISEIKHYIRDNVLKTPEGANINEGLLNQLGLSNKLRTPDEILSELETMNRKVAIFSPAVLRQLATDIVGEPVSIARAKLRGQNIYDVFKNLGKGSEFQRMIDDLQSTRDPVTGKPGKSLESVQDVYDYYNRSFGRNPDNIEVEGYFAAKMGMNMDYAFRNLSLVKNMSRLGNQEHRVFTLGSDGHVFSNFFVGSLEKEYPSGNAGSIAYIGEHKGDEVVKGFDNFAQTKLGKEIIPKIASGEYKLIKLYNVGLRPLKDFGTIINDRRISYVITKNTETRNLSFQQIPRLPGFHMEHDNPFALKQGKIRLDNIDGTTYAHYEGDTLAFLLTNRAQGEALAKIMNEVTRLIRTGDEAGAEQVAKQLPMSWSELRAYYEPKRGPGGEVSPARFSKTEDFKVVAKGKSVINTDNDLVNKYKDLNFRDSTRTGSPDKQFQVEFTGERDMYDVMQMSDEEGNARNPIWKYTPAKPVDGITSMNRALSRITNSTIMDDVKISGMEAWIQRNAKYLDLKDLGELMAAPFYHFENVKILPGVPVTTASRIEAERWAIRQFNGVPSTWDNLLKSMQDRFADDIWGADSKIAKSLATVGKWGVAALKDGPTFLRYMAFKTGIGMFALPQFFTQLNTFVPIAGIAGYGKAAQGGAAALAHTWTRFNKDPAILRTIDKKLQAFGYKPGEFIEAYEAMKGTGFDYVATETNSMMAYTKTDGIFKSTAGAIMDGGDVFFREGDRMGRYGAWYAAYKEWRDANPIGRMTEFDRAKIINRADMLTGNMTQASKSGLQTGAAAFPTQFLGYQIRMAELMLGKRLSTQQKFNLFGAYWLMYGAPVAASSVVVFPQVGEWMQDAAQKYGYTPFSKSWASWGYGPFMEGLPATLLKLATGIYAGKLSEGNLYNVGDKYGNPGLDILREAFSKDKSILEMMTGAAGSMVSNYLSSIDGYWKWMSTFLSGDDKQYKMTHADFIQPFKLFSSVNKAWQLQMAVNTHVWMSRNETALADNIGAMNAIWMASTGLQPKDTDTKTVQRLQEIQNDLQEYGLKSFRKNMHRGFDALEAKDPQQANTYFNNAKVDLELSGVPLHKRGQAYRSAADGRTRPESALWKYYIDSASPEQYKGSSEVYKYLTGKQ